MIDLHECPLCSGVVARYGSGKDMLEHLRGVHGCACTLHAGETLGVTVYIHTDGGPETVSIVCFCGASFGQMNLDESLALHWKKEGGLQAHVFDVLLNGSPYIDNRSDPTTFPN